MSEMELLQRRVEQLEAEKQQLAESNAELRARLEEKELELKLLIERFLGRKSERFIEDPDQLRLEFGDTDQVDDAIEGIKQAKISRSRRSPSIPGESGSRVVKNCPNICRGKS